MIPPNTPINLGRSEIVLLKKLMVLLTALPTIETALKRRVVADHFTTIDPNALIVSIIGAIVLDIVLNPLMFFILATALDIGLANSDNLSDIAVLTAFSASITGLAATNTEAPKTPCFRALIELRNLPYTAGMNPLIAPSNS